MRRRLLGQVAGGGVDPIPYEGDLLFWVRGLASTNFTDSGKTTPVSSDGDLIAVSADQSGAGRDFDGVNSITWSSVEPSINLTNNATGKELNYDCGAIGDFADFNVANSLVVVVKQDNPRSNNDIMDLCGGNSNNKIWIRGSGGNIRIFDGVNSTYTLATAASDETLIIAVRITSTNIEMKVNNNAWQQVKASTLSGYPGNYGALDSFSIGQPRTEPSDGYVLEVAQYGVLLTQAQTDEVITYFNSILSVY